MDRRVEADPAGSAAAEGKPEIVLGTRHEKPPPDLAAARDIKLIDQSDTIAKMRELNPGYDLVTIPKGTYPKQDRDVKVIGFHTHVVASCKLPEQTVYTMTKTIADNTKTLATVAKDIGKLTPKGMAADIGVPFHPGAAKFYKEAGIAVKAR